MFAKSSLANGLGVRFDAVFYRFISALFVYQFNQFAEIIILYTRTYGRKELHEVMYVVA